MSTRKLKGWGVALALVWMSAAFGQVDLTRYSANVADPGSSWENASRAEGTPNSNGNDDQYAKTNSNTTTVVLWSTSWQSLTIPANRAITQVWVNVLCRYNSGTSGNRVRLRVSGSVADSSLASPSWNQSSTDTTLRWRFSGNGWDITSKRAAWTAANVANLDLGVQRESGSTQLRVDGFRVIVRHEADADGDGIADRLDGCPNDPANDADGDGRCANVDNCPTTYNPDQTDLDADGIGDVCDPCVDPDRDGRCNGNDNCPTIYNPLQFDLDRDGIGDECDSDRDGDGIPNVSDACPDDGVNDADGDGICGASDNCPYTYNPGQADADQDGRGDACDACPTLPPWEDQDEDCVPDAQDNCPYAYNPDQADADQDHIGDVCDPLTDSDGDGVSDDYDSCPGQTNLQTDYDGDGMDTACDLDEAMTYVEGSGYATGAWSLSVFMNGQTLTESGGTEGPGMGSPLAAHSGGQTGGGLGGASVSASAEIDLMPGRITGSATGSFNPHGATVVSYFAFVGAEMEVELHRPMYYRRSGAGRDQLELFPFPTTRKGPTLLGPGRYSAEIRGSTGWNWSEITLSATNQCPADMDADGFVNDTDFVLFAGDYNRVSCADSAMPYGCPADINRSGTVDDTDFVLFAQGYDAYVCP